MPDICINIIYYIDMSFNDRNTGESPVTLGFLKDKFTPAATASASPPIFAITGVQKKDI